MGLGLKGLGGHRGFCARNERKKEKHRTEATEEELGLGVERSALDTVAPVRETSVKGKASHRGHRGHGGGIGIWGLKGLGGHRGFCGRNDR
jgi:hypothetical protein